MQDANLVESGGKRLSGGLVALTPAFQPGNGNWKRFRGNVSGMSLIRNRSTRQGALSLRDEMGGPTGKAPLACDDRDRE